MTTEVCPMSSMSRTETQTKVIISHRINNSTFHLGTLCFSLWTDSQKDFFSLKFYQQSCIP